MPAMILLGSFIFWATKVSILQLLGLSFAFVGAVLIVTKGNFFELITFSFYTGDLLMFTSFLIFM